MPRTDSRRQVGEVVGEPYPSTREAYFLIYPNEEVKPLELLITPIKDEIWAILRVSQVYFKDPYRTAEAVDVSKKSGIPTIPEGLSEASVLPGVYKLAAADIVDCFVDEADPRPIGRVATPVPGHPVYKADERVVRVIVGNPQHPIRIGHLAGTDNVEFVLEANSLMRHCLIVGNPGTGKSFFRGILMEDLYDLGALQVNFDPLDEYEYTVEDIGGRNVLIGRDYRPRLDYLSEGEFSALIESYVPTEFQRAIAREGFNEYVKECRRCEAIGRPIPDPNRRLIELIEEAAHRMRAGEDTRINVVERVRTLLNSLGIAGTGGLDLASEISQRKLVNFVFRNVSELQITFAVASILKEIQRLRERNQIRPLLVSADEAHLLVPSGKANPPSKGVIKRIMRYGRHFGIGVMLITQLPASLDPEVVSLPSVRVFFATSTEQIRGISYLLADLPKTVIEDIPKLERGTAIITGARDLIRHSAYVRVRSERRSRHGAPTPPLIA